MKPSNQQREAGQSIFLSSLTGLANVLAVIATFFGTGPLYSKTVDFIYRFAVTHYGYGIADFTTLIWGVLCAALIFFIARATISTALVMAGLSLAMRLF